MVPSPVVQRQGQGVVGSDYLNGLIQGVASVAQLRGLTGLTGMVVFLQGKASVADGGQSLFYWSPTSTAMDNGSTVIVPSGATVGAWLLMPPGEADTGDDVLDNPATVYSLQAMDFGTIQNFTAQTAVAVTVPPGLPLGFWCGLRQGGVGQVTVMPGTGITVVNANGAFSTALQYITLVLLGLPDGTYDLSGRTV